MDLQGDYKHRSVDFSKAKKDIDELDKKFKDFRKILISINIFLQGYAHIGKLVQHPIYIFQTQKSLFSPPFEVLYSFDDKEVRVHNIGEAEEENESVD